MLVEVEVSSMNTSRAGSNIPCSRIQRRRARATSGRSCSAARRLFFEADAMAGEQPPDCTAAAGDPSLAHRNDDLIQRQIRLLGNQRQQKVRVLLQRRDAPPGRLGRYTSRFVPALHPFDSRADAHLEAFGRLAARRTRFNRSSTRSRKSKEHGFGIDRPPKIESIPQELAHPKTLGNPQIQLSRDVL